jgi:hypothetical protein
VYCIEVPDYTVHGYTWDAQCYIVATHCFTIVTRYYIAVVPD